MRCPASSTARCRSSAARTASRVSSSSKRTGTATCRTRSARAAAAASPFSPSTTSTACSPWRRCRRSSCIPGARPKADPTRPDRLVFDLDPGEGMTFADVVAAAHEVRDRLRQAEPRELLPHHRRQGAARRRPAASRHAAGTVPSRSAAPSPRRWRRTRRSDFWRTRRSPTGAGVFWSTGYATASAPRRWLRTARARGQEPASQPQSPGPRSSPGSIRPRSLC